MRPALSVSVRRVLSVSMRRMSFVMAIGVAAFVVGCQSQPAVREPTPVGPEYGVELEAISLLGDTLRRPQLDSAARERMQAQLVEARLEAAARPNDADALIWVGRRLAYLGRYRDAIRVFSDGIRRFPNDPRLYRHRGHRYISVRQFDDAIADLERGAQLMASRPDEVEPDGQPNARNIPIGSLQSNVWYHLALGHYLKGDWDRAIRAARSGLAVSANADRLVSQTHWVYMALRRAGRASEAAAALEPIRDDFDVIENQSYYRLVRMYKGSLGMAVADSALTAGVRSASDASLAYGLANWYLYNGDTTRAVRAFERLLAGGQWASFGYIAAEADLARIRSSNR
jgi:tetratricopeptide (TPR) repeat protein